MQERHSKRPGWMSSFEPADAGRECVMSSARSLVTTMCGCPQQNHFGLLLYKTYLLAKR